VRAREPFGAGRSFGVTSVSASGCHAVTRMEQHNLAGPPRGALASVNNHAIRQGGPQTHWVPNDSELDQLRHFLAERPDDGGPPLELLQPDDPELGPKAKKLMERDGYVIVVDALSSQELQQMRQATHWYAHNQQASHVTKCMQWCLRSLEGDLCHIRML
jgi:hypothetical protein